MREVILDTNTLLDGIDLSQYLKIYLPITVLEELDKIKHGIDAEKSYKARQAIRQIEDATNIEYKLDYTYSLPIWLDRNVPDNKILGFAKENCTINKNVVLLSNDINMRIKAKALGIPCEKYSGNDKSDEIYKGYKTLSGGTYFINELFENIGKGINDYNFVINEYLLLYNSDTDKLSELRFDGQKFVQLKLPDSKVIKGKNSEQRFALDLLFNKDIPIKIIAGGFGSGKTLLSVKTGLHHVVDKGTYKNMMFIRNPIVTDGAEIGFLPGDKSEKIYDFCRPFLQYVEDPKNQFFADNLIKEDKIKMDVISFLKGVSIEDSYVIMDESEDLNVKLMKLVGSRIGDKSCIVFTGDWNQAENKYKHDNGLLKLIQEGKGNKLVGIVVLDEDLRSPASKVFAELK